MNMITNLVILETGDLIHQLEEALGGVRLNKMDIIELFTQFTTFLETQGVDNITVINLIDYNSLMFANHLDVNKDKFELAAMRVIMQYFDLLAEHKLIRDDGVIMYGPAHVSGEDLCLRRFNN